MDIFNIQALIKEGKIVTPSDVDPTNSYLQLGVYQEGNRKNNSANPAYPPFAIRLSDLGSATNPIVRYVYLIPDASDATRMGGTAANVYTTFQTAYTAADTLQTTLGGTVYLVVYGDNSASNLVLTSNFNPDIRLIGESPFLSEVGNINLNAAGTAYDFGTALSPIYISNIKVGNITAQPGTSGDGGEISIVVDDIISGNIINYPTSAANILGNTKDITIFGNNGTSKLSTVTNGLSALSTGNTGNLTITSNDNIVVESIFRPAGGEGTVVGNMTLQNVEVVGTVQRFMTAFTTTTISNCKLGELSIIEPSMSGCIVNISNVVIIGSPGAGGNIELIGIYYNTISNLTVQNGQFSVIDCTFFSMYNSNFNCTTNNYVFYVDSPGLNAIPISGCDFIGGSPAYGTPFSGVVYLNNISSMVFQGCNTVDSFGAFAFAVDGDPTVINTGFFNQGSNYLAPGGIGINNFNLANDFPVLG